MYKMTFAQRFKFLRSLRDMSQDELAADFEQKTGSKLTKSGISGYENGKRIPEVALLQTMAEYFDVSIDYLLGRSDEKQSDSPTFNDDGYQEIFEMCYNRLVEENIIKKGEHMPPQFLKLFLVFGADHAVKILQAKGIDPSVLTD